MNTYYEVIARMSGATYTLYGSFVRNDCKHEIEAEREGWKEEGYIGIKIVARATTDEPDLSVYTQEELNEEEN